VAVENGLGSQSDGIAFIVSAGIVYEIIAANCSSPQTTELNAGARTPTLMKWVNLGVAQSVLFVGLAAHFDRKHAKPIIVGAGLAIAIQYAAFTYASKSGLSNPQTPTEDYGKSGGVSHADFTPAASLFGDLAVAA
jgi:hypothetical protein